MARTHTALRPRVLQHCDCDCDHCLLQARGEDANNFSSVFPEYATAYHNGGHDRWDATRGACCERVRDQYNLTLQCQQWVVRPRTRFTFDWLRLAHMSLDRKGRLLQRCVALPRGPPLVSSRWPRP